VNEPTPDGPTGRPRRIILFYKHLTTAGGAERLLAEEWAHFTNAGCTVKIVCFSYANSSLYEHGDAALRDVFVCPGASWFAKLVSAARFIRRFEPDAIIVAAGLIELGLITGRNSKLIHHYHQPPSMSFMEYLKYSWVYAKDFDWLCARNRSSAVFREIRAGLPLHRRLVFELKARAYRATANRCAALLVFSDYAKEDAERLFTAPVVVLKGALDRDAVLQMGDLHAHPRKGPPVVLSVGRLDPVKRMDVVIRAMAHLRQQIPDVRCLIAGDGPHRPELKQLIEQQSLADTCELLGFVPETELMRLYQTCDAFVSVDWADFRLTAFEALLGGTPVVVSDEADVDPKLAATGYLSSAAPEPAAVAAELHEVLDDSRRRDFAALRAALQDYTWSSYCDAVLKLV